MALKTYRPDHTRAAPPGAGRPQRPVEGRPVKMLVEGKTKTGGRNNDGRITSRHIGGGAKQSYRRIDFRRRKYDVAAQGRAA